MANNLDAIRFLGPAPGGGAASRQPEDLLAAGWKACLDSRPGIVIRCVAALHRAYRSCVASACSGPPGAVKADPGLFARAQAQVDSFESALQEVALTLSERAPCVPDCYLMERVRSEATRWFPDNGPAQLVFQAEALNKHFQSRRPAMFAGIDERLRMEAHALTQGRDGYDPFNTIDQVLDAVYQDVISEPHQVWAEAGGLERFAMQALRRLAAGEPRGAVVALQGGPVRAGRALGVVSTGSTDAPASGRDGHGATVSVVSVQTGAGGTNSGVATRPFCADVLPRSIDPGQVSLDAGIASVSQARSDPAAGTGQRPAARVDTSEVPKVAGRQSPEQPFDVASATPGASDSGRRWVPAHGSGGAEGFSALGGAGARAWPEMGGLAGRRIGRKAVV